MSLLFRRTFFYFYIGLFLLVTPLVVLYTTGYRFDFSNRRLVQVGALSVESTPKGAQVFLNDKELSGRTPTLQKLILPGTYQLKIKKDGYKIWQREVEIKSRQTTVVADVGLFLEAEPKMLKTLSPTTSSGSDNGLVAYIIAVEPWLELWVYDPESDRYTLLDRLSSRRVSDIRLHWTHDSYLLILDDLEDGAPNQHFYTASGPLSDKPNWFAPFAFINTDDQTALTRTKNGLTETIALLPKDTYRLADVFNNLVLIQNQKQQQLVLVDAATQGPPILLNTSSSFYRWQESNLLYSDGFELHRYDSSTNSDIFITRGSNPITDLLALENPQTLLIVSPTQTLALDISDLSRAVGTVLVTAESIQSFWLDARDRNGYFFGTVNGSSGLFTVALNK